jgi:hypothetical protein
MGIGKRVLKGVGYATAPRLTFAATNPKKAAFGKAAEWAIDRVAPNRRKSRNRNNTLTGLGAAAVAVPIGFWIGRRFWSASSESQQM